MDDVTSMIKKEVLQENTDIRDRFMKHFQDDVTTSIENIAKAYHKWEEFDSEVGEHEQKATVSALLFYVINAQINSLRLLLTGYLVASGNLMRHAIEALPVAILCSNGNHTYFQKFIHNKFSVNKALDRLSKNSTKFGVHRTAVEKFKRGRKFYDQYSHPTRLSVVSVISLTKKGELYVGPSFDEGKLDAYKKEFKTRSNFTENLVSAIDGIIENAKWI